MPSALTEGETTNLRVRMDYTNISLCRPVRYSTEPVPQLTADNRLHVISLYSTENQPISEKSITGHCPAKTVCQTLINKKTFIKPVLHVIIELEDAFTQWLLI